MLGVVVSCRGMVYGRYIVDLTDTAGTSVDLPPGKLPAGVAQVTLFEPSGAIVADRLFFSRGANLSEPIRVTADKESYGPFEPVELTFSMEHGAPFSLSVADDSDHARFGSDICASLLLGSELRGYIHEPAWYFEDPGDTLRSRALDCLMMIQGWRRYPWEFLSGQQERKNIVEPEAGIDVRGRVVARLSSAPQRRVMVSSLLSRRLPENPDSLAMIWNNCVTDSLGRFCLSPDISDEWMLILTAHEVRKNKNKSKDVRIMIDGRRTTPSRRYEPGEMNVGFTATDAADTVELVHGSPLDRTLREVTVTARVDSKELEIALNRATSSVCYDVEQARDELIDSSVNDIVYIKDLLVKLDPAFHIRRVRHENVLCHGNDSVIIVVDHEPYVKNVILVKVPKYGGKEIRSLADIEIGLQFLGSTKIEMKDTLISLEGDNDILNLPVNIVKRVYFNHNPDIVSTTEERIGKYRYSSRLSAKDRRFLSSYVVFIETFPDKRVPVGRGSRRLTLQGYSRPAEFYSPSYDGNPPMPFDYRRTLYWNPCVEPDPTGTARVRFYNNACARSFVITAEGILPDGTPATLRHHKPINL